MSVYIDVWHRTHPLTPANHRRFLDYYGEFVVAPPSEHFEVVAGFRYTEGATNEDFALYRYASMAAIEESMRSFGGDPDYVSATERLFAEIEIEETRGIAIHVPYAEEARIDALIAEAADRRGEPCRYVRSVRTCGGTRRTEAFEGLEALALQIEKGGEARLVAGFHYLVGPVMDLVEIWQLAPGVEDFEPLRAAASPALIDRLAGIAPERERRRLAPTPFSKLQ